MGSGEEICLRHSEAVKTSNLSSEGGVICDMDESKAEPVPPIVRQLQEEINSWN